MMKACVVVIGIAGGVLNLLFGLFLLLYGGVAGQAGLGARLADLGNGLGARLAGSVVIKDSLEAGVMFLIVGAVAIVGGALGRKRPALGAILMLMAAVPGALLGGWTGVALGALLLLGAIGGFFLDSTERTAVIPF